MNLKVLHVNNVASVASNLVHGLQALGVDAELFQPTIGTFQASKFTQILLPIIRTGEAYQLSRYIQRNGFNVVHIHYAALAYLALVGGFPYYLHCHGSDLRRDLNRPGFRELTVLGIRKARRVFYSTPDLSRILQPIRQDSIFIPNPIDLSIFFPQENLGNNNLSILSISKIDPYKGIEQIIQTIELIWKSRPQTDVGFIGFGKSVNIAAPFIEKNRHRTNLKIFFKNIPHDQMRDLINSYNIVLGQQSNEIGALGMSELEAMACAKPVVCHFVYPDVYPEPPPILISQTPEEACNHAINLINNPDYLNQIGELSRKWVTQFHDIYRIAKVLLNYYEN